MANPEHLKILKRGVQVWNRWREENSEITPQLQGEDFQMLNLRGVDLHDANLAHSDFDGTFLKEANLTGADLRGAMFRGISFDRIDYLDPKYLTDEESERVFIMGGSEFAFDLSFDADPEFRTANLEHANLRTANLAEADLEDANLQGADLFSANLRGANLLDTSLIDSNLGQVSLWRARLVQANCTGANFESAELGFTLLCGANLSGARALESCRHRATSYIDFQTIVLSGGLPLSFLRGAGLPDTLIEHIPSLLAQPFDFYSCFISYGSKDHNFAERLHADLQDAGVRCWFAPDDMKIGDRIRPRLDESIRLHDKLLLIISETSLDSQWIEQEVESALEKERREKAPVLFPIRLDDAVMDSEGGWPQLIRNTRHIGDFTNWKDHDSYRKAFERLLRDLKAEPTKSS